ncbi:MAG: flagellar biosynthetic protein FliO [Rhodothermales bacterium]
MFQLSERLSTQRGARRPARQYLKRAALFGAGLLLLWVALQLLPGQTSPEDLLVYSDDAGTIAAPTENAAASRAPSLFTFGNLVAVVLLGGGVVAAIYLRRRASSDDHPTAITTMGECPIGPGQSLQLVECAGEILLLGVASGQISLLRTYDADRFDSAVLNGPTSGVPVNPHFADVLRRYSGDRSQLETNGSTC